MLTTQTRVDRRLLALPATLAIALLAMAIGPTMASALTIDFESFVHGEVVTGVGGVTIVADNYRRSFDYAVAFDSDETGTEDPDLEAEWSGGNLAGTDERLGNILIIQERLGGCITGVCDEPDDEGGRAAGTLTLTFDESTPVFGFDLIDIDSTMAENGAITLWDAQGASWSADFMTVLSGFDIGDNTANRIDPLHHEELGIGEIVKAEFLMGGSGGIDNIEYQPSIIPEPSTALLMSLGLLGLARSGRRTA